MTKKITKRRVGRYSDAIRERAAIEYAVCGSMKQVSRDMDIPRSCLIDWKDNWPRWVETTTNVRHEKQDELRAKYVDVCELAIDHTKNKLPEATAQQAMVIAGIATDKLYRADNLPGTLTGSAVSIDDLAKEFNKLANKNVVSVQTKNDETEEIE